MDLHVQLAIIGRVALGAFLGYILGLDRALRGKDAGDRTFSLVALGSAAFVALGVELYPDSADRVIQGVTASIGFLGAGLILHTKSRVLGLTSAATVFVVAAIGMTCGAGMYMEAVIATVLLLIALQIIGAMEGRLGWKRYPMVYEVRAEVGAVMGKDVVGAGRAEELARQVTAARVRMTAAILKVLDAVGQRFQVIDRDSVAGWERVSFTVIATKRKHAQVLAQLRSNDATDHVVVFEDAEVE